MRCIPLTTVYEKPFLTVDLSIDKECSALLNYSLESGVIHELLNKYTDHVLPTSDNYKCPPHVSAGDMVYLNDWKSNTAGYLSPKCKGPYWVILCTPNCSKIRGALFWAHISRIKPVTPSQETHEQINVRSNSCEPVEDLKLLFKQQ